MRYGGEDTFWTEAKGAHCAEAWECISRYIYTALQGGSIMRGWTNDDRLMIACCNDGTRPVIFKIQRLDYKVVRIEGMGCENCAAKVDILHAQIQQGQKNDDRFLLIPRDVVHNGQVVHVVQSEYLFQSSYPLPAVSW